MANEEGFLARWSRRKRADPQARADEERPPTEAAADAAAPAETPEPPALPPVESLGRDSDYTVFLQAGVPEATRRAALRKLWTSDPVLANLDGLLEYGEDFRAAFSTPGVVATLYRVGEGMIADPAGPPAAETAPSAAPAEDAPAPATPGEPEADDGKSGAA
jgi:hypothetical protein